MKAETIAKALRGRKVGSGWMAPCPAHDDRAPSLSIRDEHGVALVHCHAGCDQRDLIQTLWSRGLWDDRSHRHERPLAPSRPCAVPGPSHEETIRQKLALTLWAATVPATGSPVETYLISRGLILPPSPALRFHPALKHPSGGTWPAMVALVTRGVDGIPIGIHRTFLARDGKGKAPVQPQKMMLGPCCGGAVRLVTVEDVLMVGEGIESCLAAMQATGRPVWSALSTSGLRKLDLPDQIREVVVLADGDDPGEAAARNCAQRWRRQHREVRIARPPRGLDFNDVLFTRAASAVELAS